MSIGDQNSETVTAMRVPLPPAQRYEPARPAVQQRPPRRRRWLGVIAGAGAVVVAAAAALVVSHGGGTQSATTTGYTFHTYNNSADPTFNQLLGITKPKLRRRVGCKWLVTCEDFSEWTKGRSQKDQGQGRQ